MKQVRVTDERTGETCVVLVRKDTPVVQAPVEKSAETEVRRFIGWWYDQCRKRHISPPAGDSALYRITRAMMRKYGPERLRAMGRFFFENYGHQLRGEDPVSQHFILFAKKQYDVESQMRELGLWSCPGKEEG